jgi:hypothetical protein
MEQSIAEAENKRENQVKDMEQSIVAEAENKRERAK